jgi:hypothetical protein
MYKSGISDSAERPMLAMFFDAWQNEQSTAQASCNSLQER